MTKQKQKQTPFEQFMSNLIKRIGLLILKKINVWKEKRTIQKKFDKQVKYNIKKNQEYAKVKNIQKHSLDNKSGDIYEPY